MVEPKTTTMMIDAGQIDGRCAMGNPECGDHDKKLVNLDENAMRNHKEGQSTTTTTSKIANNTTNADLNQLDEGQKDGRNSENKSRNTTMQQFFSKKDKNIEANIKQVSGKSVGAHRARKKLPPLNEEAREQKDKKQKLEGKIDLEWDKMDENQHEMNYIRHQTVNDNDACAEDDEDKMN